MKVNLESRVGGLTGKTGDVVYCYYRHYNVMYARQYVYPELSEHNRQMGSVTTNMARLEPSEGYRQDLRDYVWSYNSLRISRQAPLRAWNNAFMRLMYAMAKGEWIARNIDLQSVVGVDLQSTPENSRKSQQSRGCNPPDTTGYNPMLQSKAEPGVEQLSKAAVDRDGDNTRNSSIGMLLYGGEPVVIDLRTITREFIYENDLPCISVKRAVEAGLLPKVKGWESLNQEI